MNEANRSFRSLAPRLRLGAHCTRGSASRSRRRRVPADPAKFVELARRGGSFVIPVGRLFAQSEQFSDRRMHDFAAARDGKDGAYAREYNEKYAERLKTELY